MFGVKGFGLTFFGAKVLITWKEDCSKSVHVVSKSSVCCKFAKVNTIMVEDRSRLDQECSFVIPSIGLWSELDGLQLLIIWTADNPMSRKQTIFNFFASFFFFFSPLCWHFSAEIGLLLEVN
jgi:hypothetical protein